MQNTHARALRCAAAQMACVPEDIAANARRHLDFIDAAARERVDLLVFPELSLSGYEPSGLQSCAIHEEDARLTPLAERAAAAGMTVVLGAPIVNPDGLPFIGAVTLHPDGRRAVYRKRFLHDGEERYASAGAALCQVHDVGGVKTALAICADTSNAQHPHAAAISGANLYIAGSLITPGGYEKDSAMLSSYARLFRMDVLMANHAASSGGYESAGRSAFWSAGGALLGAAPGPGELLLVVNSDAHVVPMDKRS